MKYNHTIVVRGYELDSYGHLNNAVYFNYLEQTRWEIIRETGLYEYITQDDLMLVVIENHIKYIREAVLFDELGIQTIIKKESPYIVFLNIFMNNRTNLKMAKASVKTLLINKDRMPVDIPEIICQKLFL
ncbi:MAG: acyl-CoA thioesterase [Bacteroidota bacterium]